LAIVGLATDLMARPSTFCVVWTLDTEQGEILREVGVRRAEEVFADFVRQRSPELLRSAWLLTGDWHAAHDLVQTALEKSWPRWGRRIDHLDAYVRRVMLTSYLSWRRRRWNAEIATAKLPERAGSAEQSDLRITLLRALQDLTPRQRAVIVLRYFCDLSEAQAAEVLGCSIGSVKSHASRGLQQLRATPGLAKSLGVEVTDGQR
jgi:RNA polymerase sigma-70 factor (sigma-E family)